MQACTRRGTRGAVPLPRGHFVRKSPDVRYGTRLIGLLTRRPNPIGIQCARARSQTLSFDNQTGLLVSVLRVQIFFFFYNNNSNVEAIAGTKYRQIGQTKKSWSDLDRFEISKISSHVFVCLEAQSPKSENQYGLKIWDFDTTSRRGVRTAVMLLSQTPCHG